MQWDIEVNQQKIAARPVQQLEALLKLTADDIKAGQGFLCVVDLRKVTEISKKPALKELDVRYVSVPVVVETFSEQDMDFVRREFARHWGRVLIVSEGGVRATFFALAHAARAQKWTLERALSECPALAKEKPWLDYLTAYLSRHQAAAR